MKKNFVRIVACLLLLAFSAQAEYINIVESGAYISDYSTKELQDIYDELEYDNYIKPAANVYPRIFVKNIPSDFPSLQDKTYRNQVFFKIIAPLALKINEEILEQREDLLAIEYGFKQTKDFHEADIFYLESLAKRYEIATPFKGTRRYMKLLNELLRRVDAVPPSILAAAAAIYTDWGTSRIALQGNNLYKAKVWYTDEGLVPADKDDLSYRYKIYPSLEAGIRDYVHKINSNINYEQFWNARKVARTRGDTLYGARMDWAMTLDSNLQNYAGLLDYTLTYYKLYNLDEAELEEEYEFND